MGREPKKLQLIEIDQSGKALIPLPQTDFVKDVCAQNAKMYSQLGFQQPWIAYLAQLNDEIVGTCAFKGPPQDHQVEIAYFTFPEFTGSGFATQMASSLVQISLKHDANVEVIAYTLPEKNASNHILQKIGFQYVEELEHPEDGVVWKWELRSQ